MYRVPWWKRWLIRLIPSVVISIAHPMRGLRLCINIKKQRLWFGRINKISEYKLMKALEPHISTGMTVYDIGANIGLHTVWMARKVGQRGHVVAFEPEPENTDLLRRALAVNHLPNVQVIEACVCENSGTTRFVRDEQSGATGTIERLSADGNTLGNSWFGLSPSILEVPTVSIDDFVYHLGNSSPDFIKIDVEGSETVVILGAVNTLSSRRPMLAIEFHNESSMEHVRSVLQPLGYKCFLPCSGALAEVEQPSDVQGSHMILRRDKPFSQVVVPDHKELDRGTLRAIIRHAGLSVKEFAGLLG